MSGPERMAVPSHPQRRSAKAGEEEGMWAELGSRGAVLMGVSDGAGGGAAGS